MANTQQTAAAVAAATKTPFEALVEANKALSVSLRSTSVTIRVIRVTDWKPTTKGNLPVKMVITDQGNYFPLASAITNLPTSFKQPVEAEAVFTIRKDALGNDRLNMSRLEFAGLESGVNLAIKAMVPGTSLFASAAGIGMN